jgi:hypothetical protein
MMSGDISQTLQVNIVADDAGSTPALDRVNKALDGMEQVGKRAARSISDGLDGMSRGFVRLAEAAGILIGLKTAFDALFASAVRASAATSSFFGQQASGMNLLVNSWRAFELVASRFNPFSVVAVGAGVATEASYRFLRAQADVIAQQQRLSGLNKHSFSAEGIAQIEAGPGRATGVLSETYLGMYNQLIGADGKMTGAVSDLGINPRTSAGGADILTAIAAGLAAIEDPADRARMAVKLFKDEASTALDLLNARFVENSERVKDWGLVLSEDGKNALAQFTKDVGGASSYFKSFGDDIDAVGKKISTSFAEWTLNAYQSFRDLLKKLAAGDPGMGGPINAANDIRALLNQEQSAASTGIIGGAIFRGFMDSRSGKSPFEDSLASYDATEADKFATMVANSKGLADQKKAALDLYNKSLLNTTNPVSDPNSLFPTFGPSQSLLGEAGSIAGRQDNSLEGLREQLSKAKAAKEQIIKDYIVLDDTGHPIIRTDLDVAQRLSVAQQLTGVSGSVSSLMAKVAAGEAGKKATEEAQQLALELGKKIIQDRAKATGALEGTGPTSDYYKAIQAATSYLNPKTDQVIQVKADSETIWAIQRDYLDKLQAARLQKSGP